MVRSRAAGGNEFVSHAPGERQVGDRAVQMTELASTEPELDSSEAMVMRRDPLPARDRGTDGLYRRTWGKGDAVILGVRVFDHDACCSRSMDGSFLLSDDSGSRVHLQVHLKSSPKFMKLAV
jgi:hypothetical protein